MTFPLVFPCLFAPFTLSKDTFARKLQKKSYYSLVFCSLIRTFDPIKLKTIRIMIDVKATLASAEERMEMAAMYLEEELNRVRAGRANVAILSGVRVESYGQKIGRAHV